MQPLATNAGIGFERTKAGQVGDIIIIIILIVIAFLLEDAIILQVRQREIPDAPVYDMPDTVETISNTNLVLASFLPWYILFVLDLILFRIYDASFSYRHWLKQFYIMNKMAWFAGSLNIIVTDIIKCAIGYPRPYFQTAKDEFDQGLIDESELDEARVSFVSGHSSISMNSLLLLTLMMHSAYKYTQSVYYRQLDVKMINSDNPHSYYLCWLWHFIREIPILSMIIVFAPTIAAIYIGLTRIVDYKHFPVDVVSGMLIGGFCAVIAHSLFWNETYFAINSAFKKKYDVLELTEVQHLNVDPEAVES